MTTFHRSRCSIAVAFTCWLAVSTAQHCSADTTEVYLLGGQSNMFSGIESAFIAEMQSINPGPTIRSSRYRVGGVGLHSGWHGQVWRGDTTGPNRLTFYPGTRDNDPNTGAAYAAMLNTWKRALVGISRSGPYEIKGILWVHGEQDTGFGNVQQISAESYADNLQHLSDRLHDDLGLSEPVPFVYSRLLSTYVFYPFADEIRQQQDNADADSGHADSFSNAYLVDTTGLTFTDLVHYDEPSQRLLGQRMAQEMNKALTSVPEPSSVCSLLIGIVLTTLGVRQRRRRIVA